jgi:hypothetical protein
MYRMAELPLSLRLIDSNGQPLRDAAGVEISLDNAWGDNAELVLSREETQYQTLHDANCSGISTAQTESTQHVLAGSRDLLLAPQMRYGAELRAGDDFTAYRFSFLTSRYASFRHHAHSFIDAAWDHFRLRDEPDYVVDPVAFAAALALTEDDATAFERLFALFDLAPRGYPERLEITVLNDRDADYGFLLESPEALDWGRLGLALSTANPAQPVTEWRIGPAKLIDAELVTFARNPSPDYNRQWVELMVQQDIDLTGHVLDAAAAADPESFAPLFVFPAGSLYRAGTVLRVHMGADPGSDPQSREDVYLYADHGESRLAARSMTLRLTTADRTVLHARPFQRGLGSQAAAARLIPSADGARAFLIPLAANGTPGTPLARSHRLELTWQRDIGAAAPVLKRFGFTGPERTTLHFDMAARLP